MSRAAVITDHHEYTCPERGAGWKFYGYTGAGTMFRTFVSLKDAATFFEAICQVRRDMA